MEKLTKGETFFMIYLIVLCLGLFVALPVWFILSGDVVAVIFGLWCASVGVLGVLQFVEFHCKLGNKLVDLTGWLILLVVLFVTVHMTMVSGDLEFIRDMQRFGLAVALVLPAFWAYNATIRKHLTWWQRKFFALGIGAAIDVFMLKVLCPLLGI